MKKYIPLFEFITSQISELKQYLNQSYESKINELIERGGDWLFNIFKSKLGLKNTSSEDNRDYRKWIEKTVFFNPEKYFYENTPAWFYLTETSITKNQWLIHFTDTKKNALDIAKNGFKNTIENYDKLGLTRNANKDDIGKNGFIFCFTLQNYAYVKKSFQYGKNFVIFKASGITVYHEGDEEYQTIVVGKEAKNIIPVIENNGYIIYSKEGNKLVSKDNIDDIVKWVELNYDQYKNKI